MSHRIIVINSQTPPPAGAAASEVEMTEPEFSVRVEFHPADSLTPAQIGNEVARIQRKVNQIIEAAAD